MAFRSEVHIIYVCMAVGPEVVASLDKSGWKSGPGLNCGVREVDRWHPERCHAKSRPGYQIWTKRMATHHPPPQTKSSFVFADNMLVHGERTMKFAVH